MTGVQTCALPISFNPNTHIRYELAEPCKLDLSVYNTAGKKIATIFRGEQTGGHYEIEWNAADLASGVYYCLLEAQGRSGIHRRVQKMVLVR